MGTQQRQGGGGHRLHVVPPADAAAFALPDLDHLNPVDPVAYNEGEFVGFYLGVPFDWDILSPELMKRA